MKRMKFPKERPTECPICSGEMDEMDQTFFPCPCHFQLCAFCYNTISKSDHPNCPYCRQPYDEDNHVYHKKPEAPKQKQPAKKVDKLDDRDVEALSKKRVLQRNLVYVTGLPPKIATDEILRSDHFFGRFGQVTYIEVAVPPNVNRNHLKCAYISYADDESAKKAIEALNKVPYAGSIINASYGTNRYCKHFLAGRTCPIANCTFVHSNQEDSITIDPELIEKMKGLKLRAFLTEKASQTNPQNPSENTVTDVMRLATENIQQRKHQTCPFPIPSFVSVHNGTVTVKPTSYVPKIQSSWSPSPSSKPTTTPPQTQPVKHQNSEHSRNARAARTDQSHSQDITPPKPSGGQEQPPRDHLLDNPTPLQHRPPSKGHTMSPAKQQYEPSRSMRIQLNELPGGYTGEPSISISLPQQVPELKNQIQFGILPGLVVEPIQDPQRFQTDPAGLSITAVAQPRQTGHKTPETDNRSLQSSPDKHSSETSPSIKFSSASRSHQQSSNEPPTPATAEEFERQRKKKKNEKNRQKAKERKAALANDQAQLTQPSTPAQPQSSSEQKTNPPAESSPTQAESVRQPQSSPQAKPMPHYSWTPTKDGKRDDEQRKSKQTREVSSVGDKISPVTVNREEHMPRAQKEPQDNRKQVYEYNPRLSQHTQPHAQSNPQHALSQGNSNLPLVDPSIPSQPNQSPEQHQNQVSNDSHQLTDDLSDDDILFGSDEERISSIKPSIEHQTPTGKKKQNEREQRRDNLPTEQKYQQYDQYYSLNFHPVQTSPNSMPSIELDPSSNQRQNIEYAQIIPQNPRPGYNSTSQLQQTQQFQQFHHQNTTSVQQRQNIPQQLVQSPQQLIHPPRQSVQSPQQHVQSQQSAHQQSPQLKLDSTSSLTSQSSPHSLNHSPLSQPLVTYPNQQITIHLNPNKPSEVVVQPYKADILQTPPHPNTKPHNQQLQNQQQQNQHARQMQNQSEPRYNNRQASRGGQADEHHVSRVDQRTHSHADHERSRQQTQRRRGQEVQHASQSDHRPVAPQTIHQIPIAATQEQSRPTAQQDERRGQQYQSQPNQQQSPHQQQQPTQQQSSHQPSHQQSQQSYQPQEQRRQYTPHNTQSQPPRSKQQHRRQEPEAQSRQEQQLQRLRQNMLHQPRHEPNQTESPKKQQHHAQQAKQQSRPQQSSNQPYSYSDHHHSLSDADDSTPLDYDSRRDEWSDDDGIFEEALFDMDSFRDYQSDEDLSDQDQYYAHQAQLEEEERMRRMEQEKEARQLQEQQRQQQRQQERTQQQRQQEPQRQPTQQQPRQNPPIDQSTNRVQNQMQAQQYNDSQVQQFPPNATVQIPHSMETDIQMAHNQRMMIPMVQGGFSDQMMMNQQQGRMANQFISQQMQIPQPMFTMQQQMFQMQPAAIQPYPSGQFYSPQPASFHQTPMQTPMCPPQQFSPVVNPPASHSLSSHSPNPQSNQFSQGDSQQFGYYQYAEYQQSPHTQQMSPYQTRFDGQMNSGLSVSQQATQAFSQSVHTVQPFVPRGKLKESSQMMDQSQNRYGYQNQMLYSPVAQTPHSDTRPKQGQMSITINPMEKPFPLILPKNFQSIEQTHSPTSGST